MSPAEHQTLDEKIDMLVGEFRSLNEGLFGSKYAKGRLDQMQEEIDAQRFTLDVVRAKAIEFDGLQKKLEDDKVFEKVESLHSIKTKAVAVGSGFMLAMGGLETWAHNLVQRITGSHHG